MKGVSFMKITKNRMNLVLAFLLMILGSIAHINSAWSADTVNYLPVFRLDDSGNGSLRAVLNAACTYKLGRSIIDFNNFADSQKENRIMLKSPLLLPSSCTSTVEIAGLKSKEIIIDGSGIPQGTARATDPICSISAKSNGHSIHHLTFINSTSYAVCAMGNNISITDNYIGIKKNGAVNANDTGVLIAGNNATLVNNVVAGNKNNGIEIKGKNSLLQGNYIGVTSSTLNDDQGSQGNQGAGIKLEDGATGNTIGRNLPDPNGTPTGVFVAAQKNYIKFNKGGGVILSGQNNFKNYILFNEIARNTDYGISLTEGANKSIDAPSDLVSVPNGTHRWYIAGKGKSGALVEIFKLDSNDFGVTEQGKSFLAATIVRNDGTFSASVSNSSILSIGNNLTSTQTTAEEGTSEFSGDVLLADQPEQGSTPIVPTTTPPSTGPIVIHFNPHDPAITGRLLCAERAREGDTNCDGVIDTPNCAQMPSAQCTQGTCCDLATCNFKPTGTDCDDGDANTTGTQCDANGQCVVPTTTTPTCGNGVVEGDEQCDDNNTTDGDGCSHDCKTESIAPPPPDQGNNSNPGNSNNPDTGPTVNVGGSNTGGCNLLKGNEVLSGMSMMSLAVMGLPMLVFRRIRQEK
jgi:cysteine-rich repeat protein